MQKYSSILYKADQRGNTAIGDLKSLATFNYSDPEHPLRRPFGNLRYLNDVFLEPGQQVTYKSSQHFCQIVLPLNGAISYGNKDAQGNYLASEEVMFLSNNHLDHIVKNPYSDQAVNYLHIGLKKINKGSRENSVYALNFKEFNKLSSLHMDKADKNVFAGAGIYRARTKGSYTLKDSRNGVFVYVINGSFEVENRLVEHRDGLALWNLDRITFESLSEFAILMVLETPLNKSMYNQ